MRLIHDLDNLLLVQCIDHRRNQFLEWVTGYPTVWKLGYGVQSIIYIEGGGGENFHYVPNVSYIIAMFKI